MTATLDIRRPSAHVAEVWLDRPEVRNAFNDGVIMASGQPRSRQNMLNELCVRVCVKLKEMLESSELSNGDRASISEIWTINPMPEGGFSEEELAAVDLSEAEEKVGPNGETLRKMISETYHCISPADEDKSLRRFIAS